MDIEKAITDGIVFKGGKSSGRKNEEKVKTKVFMLHNININDTFAPHNTEGC